MTEQNNSENDSAGMKSKRRIWPRRGIYLLPHLFTTAALFSGFYAVIQTVNGDYPRAAAAIYFAMLFDACDGRVARYTNTQSVFGAEYDSLSDVIAFGVAPALLIYQWSLVGLGKLGWAAAFVYCAAVAVRLARFNVELAGADKRFFSGLPSPCGAAVVAAFVWTAAESDINAVSGGWAAAAWLLTMVVGITMVSGVKYHSFKDVDLKSRIPFRRVALVLLAVAVIGAASDNLPVIFLGMSLLYFGSGYALFLRGMMRRLRLRFRRSDSKSQD